jgi:hypothetical protein
MGKFKDELLGECEHSSFFITNEAVGGYTAKCERGNIFADFVPSDKVIDLAKEQNMLIALAGGRWQEVGKKGFGELVKPEEAVLLVSKLRRLSELW